MTDREKAIKGVHDARRYLEDREWVDKSVGVHIDALNDALELLKQEPIKPKRKVRHGETCQYQHWCGNCMVMLHGKPKFCPNCGMEVQWE